MPPQPQSRSTTPWHHHLTLDLLVHILSTTLLHPIVAIMLPICLYSVATPTTAPIYRLTLLYTAVIVACHILAHVDTRLARGAPRKVDWSEEVVVVTGGARGLGRVLVGRFGMRGASVAVLDLGGEEVKKGVEELGEGVRFYECDVGDAEAVRGVRERIVDDLGAPTILINNAGVVNGKPMWELTTADVQRNFNVNLLAHFNTIKTFLPDMLASESGGTIVTIASVLGKLGASYLSDYTAAKAGLIAMHASLRAELRARSAPAGSRNIRTVLVTPGQLSTPLFGDFSTPSNFFGRIVEPVELADEIVKMIDAGESGEISLPLYARYIEWMHVLPVSLQRLLRALSGVDRAMEDASIHRASALHTNQKSKQ